MKKVQLIRPPMNDWYTVSQLDDHTFYPVGLCVLAKSLKTAFGSDVSVKLIDGYGKPLDEIISQVGDADFVGTTSMYADYENALAILAHAKAKGATTIIGGPNIHPIADRVLQNRSYVDYAVVNDGEQAIVGLVGNVPIFSVPNVLFRRDGQVTKTFDAKSPLRTIFDLDDIVGKKDMWTDNSVPISSIRGCIKAARSGPCDFCSLPLRFSVMSANYVWQQIDLLNKKYGYNYFWETGDDAIVGNYLDKLLVSRPKHLSGMQFKFYACPDQITPSTAKTLAQLNTREIMMGLETPNDDVLRYINKGHNSTQIQVALESLAANKIDIHVAFMYGLTGETYASAQRTFEFASTLVGKYPIKKITTSHAIPFPGTAMFTRLESNPKIASQYCGNIHADDTFDYRALTDLYLKHFTSVDYASMDGLVEKTRALMHGGRGLGTSFSVNPKNSSLVQ